jgi:hypothetical protein
MYLSDVKVFESEINQAGGVLGYWEQARVYAQLGLDGARSAPGEPVTVPLRVNNILSLICRLPNARFIWLMSTRVHLRVPDQHPRAYPYPYIAHPGGYGYQLEWV